MSANSPISNDDVKKIISNGKQYCLRIYKAGPKIDQTPVEAGRIQKEHLKYLMRLKLDGKILINGPVIGDSELKGIAIFDTTDKEEVKRLSDKDPAVMAGRLVYEVYDWVGLPGDMLS